LCLWNFSLT